MGKGSDSIIKHFQLTQTHSFKNGITLVWGVILKRQDCVGAHGFCFVFVFVRILHLIMNSGNWNTNVLELG